MLRRGVLLAFVAATGLNLTIFLIALAAIVLFPGLPTGDLAMPLVAGVLLPPLLGAILLAAIASAIMSTVSALMLVAGSALARDLYGTFRPRVRRARAHSGGPHRRPPGRHRAAGPHSQRRGTRRARAVHRASLYRRHGVELLRAGGARRVLVARHESRCPRVHGGRRSHLFRLEALRRDAPSIRSSRASLVSLALFVLVSLVTDAAVRERLRSFSRVTGAVEEVSVSRYARIGVSRRPQPRHRLLSLTAG